MISKTDIAIIGGGPVGIFTIFQAGMLDMSCHLVEPQESIGGQCKYLYPEKPIYDIPAYPVIIGGELIEKLEQQAQPFAPVYHCGRTAYKIEKLEDNKFHLELDNHEVIECSAIIIAGGCGSFMPNKPLVQNIEDFAGVHYMVEKKELFAGKNLVIAGGGDSAVDWAISLADIAQKIYLIHRRDKFSCHPKSEKDLFTLKEQGKVTIVTPYQLLLVRGNQGKLEEVVLKRFGSDETKVIPADELLIFFGLKTSLGDIENWGLEIENKRIRVEQNNCSTNIPGIYAIGDIANYPNKLKLILTGFAEASAACYDIRRVIFSSKAFNFEYSTNKGVK